MNRIGASPTGPERVRVTAMLPTSLLRQVQDIGAATGVATHDVLALCLYVGLAAGQGGDAGRTADDGTNQNTCSGSAAGE